MVQDSIIDEDKICDSVLLEAEVNNLINKESFELKTKEKTTEELEDENEKLRMYKQIIM